jgi:acyl carrier protein
MSDQTIFEAVASAIRATLGLPGKEPIQAEQLLFYDLAFTSMDMLDLLFRVEDHFQISIPENTFYELAKGDLANQDFASGGMLTPVGREHLMALLHDSPHGIFPERIHVQTLPRYCTVGAIVRLVAHKLKARQQDTCSS